MDVRERYEAQQLERRRLVLALRRGTQHGSLLREAHPERLVLGGIGVALLVLLVAAVTGLVSPRAPAGWDNPGTLVLDKDSGQRYVVDPARVLRPVLNDTSLRLIFPSGAPTAVTVSDRLVRGAHRGQPVGRTDVPFEPPTLLAADATIERCQSGDKTVVVYASAATGPPSAVLVTRGASAGDGAGLGLLTDGRLLPLADATTLQRLGYPPAAAVRVAPVVLEAVPVGPALASLTVPPGDPALPPLQREGTLVTGSPSGQSFVVAGGLLRALPTRTSVQLVFGPEPPTALAVPDAALATAPRGEPVVPEGVPVVPPTLATPPPGGAVCVDGHAVARVSATLPRGAVLPQGGTDVSTPQGTGLLLATSAKAASQPSKDSPVLLVTAGQSFAIPSAEVLAGLGYVQQQVRLVSPAFAQLAPPAAALEPITLTP